jgi:hypothetical protein
MVEPFLDDVTKAKVIVSKAHLIRSSQEKIGTNSFQFGTSQDCSS